MSAPAWLVDAVKAAPSRFPPAVAVAVLEPARLRADPSPAFPASPVLGISADALVLGLPSLRGAGSPLPSPWCALLDALPAEAAARALVDAIEDRLLRLRVAADAMRPVDAPDAFVALLAALTGLPAGVPPTVAGLLADGATAEGVAAAISAVAGVPARVLAAQGGELPLPPERRSELGRNGRLGIDLASGTSVRGPGFGFRIELGPVGWDEAPRLRPGGATHAALVAVVAAVAPPTLCWEAVLLLDTAGAPRPALGNAQLGGSARLDGAAAAIERELVHRHHA